MKENEFKEYITKFFDTDYINDSKFCKDFLYKPSVIKVFFKKVKDYLEVVDNPDISVYKNINSFTLLCAAIHRICHRYANKYPSAIAAKTACNLYIKPFCEFLIEVLFNDDIDLTKINFMQSTDILWRPYTYMVLLSYFYHNLKPNETPMFIFMRTLGSIPQINFEVDVLEDIIKPVTDENEISNYNHFYINTNKDTIFNYIYDNWIKFDKDAIYAYMLPLLNDDKNNDSFDWLKTFLFLNNIFGSFLYDIDQSGSIVNNPKWQTLLDVLWFRLENADDFDELPETFKLLLLLSVDTSTISQTLFINSKNETILFPIIRNVKYDKNAMYIKHIFNAVINHKYKTIPTGDFFRLILQDPDILIIWNSDGNDILLEILRTHFSKRSIVNSPLQVSYSSPWFDKNNTHTFSKSKSFDEYDDIEISKAYFKDILKGLIKVITRKWKGVAYQIPRYKTFLNEYFQKLYSYYDTLKEIDIDLKKLPGLRKVILDSPVEKNTRSYISSSTPIVPDNLFKDFTSKTLLNKLLKLYIRSVQSDDQSENNYDRIINIRKYLIHKYKKKIDYQNDFLSDASIFQIRNVNAGNELDILYEFWINDTMKHNLLDLKFIVIYVDDKTQKKDIAIDYGGLTRHFLTNAAKQLIRHFRLLENSDRYILDTDNTTQDQAEFIGQLLPLLIVNEIHISFPISLLYLGYMMFDDKQISIEEQFLYFILDLHKKKAEANLQLCSMPIDDYYDPCGPDELQRFINLTYTTDPAMFKAVTGQFFRKNIFYSKFASINDKIRIYDVDKLLTVKKISRKEYKKYIFDNITLRRKNGDTYNTIPKNDPSAVVYTYLEELFIVDKVFDDYYNNCEVHEDLNAMKEKYKSKKDFCNAILLFWTGVQGIISTKDYTVTIDHTDSEIKSHTCFNELKLPIDTYIKTKQDLYNAFMLMFIYDVKEVFGMQ